MIEAGLGHKIIAEVIMAAEQHPTTITVCGGSRVVKASADDLSIRERFFAANWLAINEDQVANTEYDLAVQVVSALPGFVATQHVDITDYVKLIGTLNGAKVYACRIGWAGGAPATIDKIKQAGVFESDQTMFYTAHMYPSRQLLLDGIADVAFYGIDALETVKGEPALPTLANITSELHVLAKSLLG